MMCASSDEVRDVPIRASTLAHALPGKDDRRVRIIGGGITGLVAAYEE